MALTLSRCRTAGLRRNVEFRWIADGALTAKRYKALLMIQAGIVDQPILEEVEAFQRTGGKVIASSDTQVRNVDGEAWAGASEMIRIAPLTKRQEWAQDLMVQLKEYKGFEGQLDGLWLSRRGERFFVFNSSEKPAETTINGKLMRVAPHTIYSNATDHIRSN